MDVTFDVHVSRWNDEVYDISLRLIVCDREAVTPWLRREFEDPELDAGTATPRATCFYIKKPNGRALVFWFRPGVDPADGHWAGIIAHEALHGVAYLFRDIRIDFTDPSEEAFAYYLAFLVREITERVRLIRGHQGEPNLRKIAESVDSSGDAYEATLVIREGDSGEPTPVE